jgi:hypothetical protein
VDTSHREGEPKSMTFAMEYVRFTAPNSVARTASEVVNAGPRVAGIFTSFLRELPVYLAICAAWR